jgi:hypothetical protein
LEGFCRVFVLLVGLTGFQMISGWPSHKKPRAGVLGVLGRLQYLSFLSLVLSNKGWAMTMVVGLRLDRHCGIGLEY